MVYVGAENETAAQLAEVLHYDLEAASLHPAIGAWVAHLTDSSQEGFTLNIANALWGQQGEAYEPAFLETVARYYGAAMQHVDFAGDAQGAADAVNQWVSDATQGKIPAVVDSLSPDTALVLANAIYFNAQWSTPFDASLTRDAPFTALDGTEQSASMMGVTERFAYAEGENYQLVALPYAGGRARMIVLLPAAGAFEAVEQTLTAEEFAAMLATMDAAEREVMLEFPAFEMESTTALESVLGQMGLTLPFGADADLSGINGQGNLAIDQAIHKATITVDEAGTEAAAATVIGVTTLSMPIEQAPPVAMTVDRPFLYFIQDSETGALLFVGRMVTLP
jgi:serpin B